MADNEDTRGAPDPGPDAGHEAPVEGTPVEESPTVAHPVIPAETAPAPILKSRWRDREWTFNALLAIAGASLVIGGIAGGVIVAAANHGDDDHGHHRMGPWGPRHGMGPGWKQGPRNFNGPGRGQGGQMMPYGGDDGPAPVPPSATPTPSPGATG